jgi:SOS-response transcriptional repressor LexA
MLTEKQQHVLDIITDFTSRYGKSPTIEELKNLLHQKSKRGVTQYLEVLEKKWFISRGDWYRGIRLGNGVWFQTTLNIPILGYANAGTPLAVAEANDYGTLPISKNIISWDGKNYFVLRVSGTSMNQCEVQGKTLDNGSYVLIKKDEVVPNEKDAFLFVVDGGATLKKYKKEWSNIYLLPKSSDEHHTPIILSESDNVTANGKVIDVFSF